MAITLLSLESIGSVNVTQSKNLSIIFPYISEATVRPLPTTQDH